MRSRWTHTGNDFNGAALDTLLVSAADLEGRAQRVLVAAQTLVGVDTGLLLTTIHRERGSNGDGPFIDIVAGQKGLTNYLGFHHFGTEPHVIRARRRRALRFTWHGKIVYFTKVNHPGTRANPFLLEALQAAR